MRGERVMLIRIDDPPARFIPACAGNAIEHGHLHRVGAVHPRMRGERMAKYYEPMRKYGSSPHARGTLSPRR